MNITLETIPAAQSVRQEREKHSGILKVPNDLNDRIKAVRPINEIKARKKEAGWAMDCLVAVGVEACISLCKGINDPFVFRMNVSEPLGTLGISKYSTYDFLS